MIKKHKKLIISIISVVILIPVILFLSAVIYFRHIPWKIPEKDRPPVSIKKPDKNSLKLRYLGISGYEISDGKTIILLDPTFTRPTVTKLFMHKIRPEKTLSEKYIKKAHFILVNHAHYDHIADVAGIAKQTLATVVGSKSVINLMKSRSIPDYKLMQVKDGDHLNLGTFSVDVRETAHSTILGIKNPIMGTIPQNAKKLWFWHYKQDKVFSYRIESNKIAIWFHPSSAHPKKISGKPANTLVMGITGSDITEETVKGILNDLKPKRILPSHFDNFFQPLRKGLALMPGVDYEKIRDRFLKNNPGLKWYALEFNEIIYIKD